MHCGTILTGVHRGTMCLIVTRCDVDLASKLCKFASVPDRTLGGVYLLSAFIMQWCVVVILLKFLIALGVVFIELGKQLL
jgi:hypothetical protein